jgi:predicted transcriptional regulator
VEKLLAETTGLPAQGPAYVTYTERMTQALSFRADASLAEELDAAATAAGVPRSDLLNQAVREFLYRLRCERDAERYALHPLTAAETATWSNEAWPEEDTDWTEVFSQ